MAIPKVISLKCDPKPRVGAHFFKMNNLYTAFVGGVSTPFKIGGQLPKCERSSTNARVTMQVAKKKKVAPVVFATDMKGKPVWKMRTAKEEDLESTAPLFTDSLPMELIEAYIGKENSQSLLCEGTIKGTKEGEGYKQRVFGAALVYKGLRIRDYTEKDSGDWVTYGELIGIRVHNDMPDKEAVKKTLTLGVMKKLKTDGADSFRVFVPEENDEYFKELKGMGFVKGRKSDDCIEMIANLATLNPEPLRKVE